MKVTAEETEQLRGLRSLFNNLLVTLQKPFTASVNLQSREGKTKLFLYQPNQDNLLNMLGNIIKEIIQQNQGRWILPERGVSKIS